MIAAEGEMLIAKREVWNYPKAANIWVGKYRHSHNLLHWHYDCELIYTESGCIDVFCEKETYRLTAGEALYIDGGTMHRMTAQDDNTTLIVIIFDYNIIKPYTGNLRLVSPRLKGKYDIPAAYCRVRDVLLGREPYCGAEAAAQIMTLMAAVYRGEQAAPRQDVDETTHRFMALLETVSEKYQFFTFGDAVAFMGMSESYFSRYFRKTAGVTFSQYLNYLRVGHAIDLLHDKKSRSMTEIADLCGFYTIRNFNRVFRETTGYSPRELPANFRMEDKLFYPSAASFNPTLPDCVLLESAGG